MIQNGYILVINYIIKSYAFLWNNLLNANFILLPMRLKKETGCGVGVCQCCPIIYVGGVLFKRGWSISVGQGTR